MANVSVMSSRGRGKRLNDNQRIEIIHKLQKPNAPSQRSIAREYHVSESAIRKILENEVGILQHVQFSSDSRRKTTFCASIPSFPVVEDKLYNWIDACQRKKIEVPPSIALSKARDIAQKEGIEEKFKGSWCWLFVESGLMIFSSSCEIAHREASFASS